jgi:hypothetical protein
MKRYSQKPVLEILEDRRLLATCHVVRLGDFGAGGDLGGGHSRGDLRYCITKANAEPGPDSVLLQVTGSINLASPMVTLSGELNIKGPGADQLTINGQQNGTVFFVDPGAFVEISSLKITGGETTGFGGGIHNDGNLILSDSVVTENNAGRIGGGIYNSGTLWIFASEISQNEAKLSSAGIAMGGGIFNEEGSLLSIHGSLITENSTKLGYSTVGFGGGIANLGRATIVECTISSNTTNEYGPGTIGGDGGGIYNSGDLLVESTLVAHNSANGDWHALGGGITNGSSYGAGRPGGFITVLNSTIVDNEAFVWGDSTFAGVARGGGINTMLGGSVTIRHSTIARNRSSGHMLQANSHGGGVFNATAEEQSTVPCKTLWSQETSRQKRALTFREWYPAQGTICSRIPVGEAAMRRPTFLTSIRFSVPFKTTAARRRRWPSFPAAPPSTLAIPPPKTRPNGISAAPASRAS